MSASPPPGRSGGPSAQGATSQGATSQGATSQGATSQGAATRASQRISAAKLWLTSTPVPGCPPTGNMPYLSVALYSLTLVPTDQVQRMTTDAAWRLYVNEGWVDAAERSIPEIGWELAHQVWHLVVDHPSRAADVGVTPGTSRAWRLAADLTVQEMLRASGSPAAPVKPSPATPAHRPATSRGAVSRDRAVSWAAARQLAMGDRAWLPGTKELGLPPGRSAEEYHAMLSGLPADGGTDDPSWRPGEDLGPHRSPDRGEPSPGAAGDDPRGGPTTGSMGQRPFGNGGPSDRPAPGTRGFARAASNAPAAGPDPSCGSGCDGLHRPYELPEQDDVPSLDPAAAEALRRTVAAELAAHAGQGALPASWARWIEQVLDPIVDWRNVLHAAVRRGIGWAHGQTDYTYSRISRRQAAAGPIILPALRRPVPRVGVVVDTSGSVDDGLLAQALGEIDGVLATLGVADPQVAVLAVDCAVHTLAAVRSAAAVRLSGGGGTDMALGIRAAQALRPTPDVIIVLTDGETGWPAAPLGVPVIAVILGRSRQRLPRTPGWVQRVECVR